MDITTLARQVRRRFGDNSPGFVIQDQDLIDWINEAQITVAKETHCLVATVNNTADVYPVTMTRNLRVKRVSYGGRPLIYTSLDELEGLRAKVRPLPVETDVDRGEPTHFYSYEDKVYLYPSPLVGDTTPCRLVYSQLPTLITALSGSPTIPEKYHEALVTFCVMRSHERNESLQAMAVAYEQFKAGITERAILEQELADTYPVIRDDVMDVYG